MTFIDSNYFLRFLINDVPSQYKKAMEIFKRGVDGDIKLFTNILVIFELYWVFTSFYEKPKQEVINILRKVLGMTFITVENREYIIEALDHFERSSLDLEDCYNLAYCKENNITDFASFDNTLTKYSSKIKN